jgi:small subunit ribosomal protein S17e
MGRIKTKLTKRLAFELMDRYKDRLSTDFNANKKAIMPLMDASSKKLRNIIAGYVTRLKKKD